MKKAILMALLLAGASPVVAQPANVSQTTAPGITRLELSVSASVERVPDVANISAGVMTRADSARAALAQNAERMAKVRAALKAAGVAPEDIRTQQVSLNPDYRYEQDQVPQLLGYQASNMLSVRFRDIARSGDILDALVQQGANQINGPSLTIDDPEEALDEARVKAVAEGNRRAELYAQTIGKRVARLAILSESGGMDRPPMPMAVAMNEMADGARTRIEPGVQEVSVNLSMAFDLQ